LADSSASKYGEALARLTVAENCAKEAHKLSQNFAAIFNPAASTTLASDSGTNIVEITKAHLTLCSEAKSTATKDNDLIYHETLPSEATLPVIEKSNVADPVSIQEIYGSPDVQKVVGPDIFNRLVPLSVHESASLYSEEKAKLVRNEVERCDIADGELAAALEHQGLPGSLAKFRDHSNVSIDALADPGPQLTGFASVIAASESDMPVQNMIDKILDLREKAKSNLESVSRDLDLESSECEKARVRFGHQWEQSPSSSLTKMFRSDIKSHRDALEKAFASDGQILSLWDSIRADVSVLAADDDGEKLASMLAAAITSEHHASEANLLDGDFGDSEETSLGQGVASIEDALGRLNKIKKERSDTLKDLKERVSWKEVILPLEFN
jgi:tyrosine-protein phosphatase non-receptor type 23